MAGQAPRTLSQLIEDQRLEFERLKQVQMISREILQPSTKVLASPLIKVIIGPRRAGKSTFALQLIDSRSASYVNFDDDNLIRYVNQHGTRELIQTIDSVYGKTDFLLFDELQNLPEWELLVNKLHRQRRNLIVTGSNAKLLSRELATHLTGRYVEIELLPFSWTEYKVAKGTKANISEYVSSGGFPEIVISGVPSTGYLEALAQGIILKDIVRRHRVRQPEKILELFEVLRTEFALPHTISKLAPLLNFTSKTTLQNYLSYLYEAYLIEELPRYSLKFREQLKAPRKHYVIDLGFARDHHLHFESLSRRLENTVYLHLRRQYRPPFSISSYHTSHHHEVDFAVRRGREIVRLIQVCYSLQNHSTFEREVRSLREGQEETRCQRIEIVTWDEKQIRDGIFIRTIEDFLVERSK